MIRKLFVGILALFATAQVAAVETFVADGLYDGNPPYTETYNVNWDLEGFPELVNGFLALGRVTDTATKDYDNEGDIAIYFAYSLDVVDNTYGAGSEKNWLFSNKAKAHKFSDLRGSDSWGVKPDDGKGNPVTLSDASLVRTWCG